MNRTTISQRVAQEAYCRIAIRTALSDEYVTFAKKFPALMHACGLAQAVSFALAKKEHDYLDDLTEVLKAAGHPGISNRTSLDEQARTRQLSGYIRLSRDAIHAAGWLKRYVEATVEETRQ